MSQGLVVTIGTRPVGEAQSCFVIASVASAHEGSPDTALKMIEAAFKMGADGVLFQIFRSEDLVVRRHPSRRDLEAIELRPREWRRVLGAAKASGLPLLVEPLDQASLELAAEIGASAYQVSTSDMENPELVRAFAGVSAPVLLSLGGVDEGAARECLALLQGVPAALVQGFPSFPAPLEEVRLRDLASLKQRHRMPVGFLDQTDGGSAFALVAPALAAAHGADFVEKHFTLDRTRKGRDYEPSLTPEDFYRMVELLRQAERAAGDGAGLESKGPRRTRRPLLRSIVAGALIKRGEVLTAPMLAFKRTDARYEPGLPPREAHRVIGRRAARPIQADETIREDMLE
jgi:N,N'-diacetyllegionaminate synthase